MNSSCRIALILSFSALCSCSLFRSQTPTETDLPQEQPTVEPTTASTLQSPAQMEKEATSHTTEQPPEQMAVESIASEPTPIDTRVNEFSEGEQIAPPPPAPTAELRGLRSPKMPAALPMSLDGKVQN